MIELTSPPYRRAHPNWMRRVVALVEVDGQVREMVFLTNNLQWSSQTIADLYRCRWSIEVFFKELKQTLQLADFLGHNANAVRWQIWTALLLWLLLRFCAFSEPVGSHFYPPFHPDTLGSVAETPTAKPVAGLWDSP